VASLAVEMGVSPNELLALDQRMFKAVLDVYKDRAKEAKRGSSRPRVR
jgi:hypothetical protein